MFINLFTKAEESAPCLRRLPVNPPKIINMTTMHLDQIAFCSLSFPGPAKYRGSLTEQSQSFRQSFKQSTSKLSLAAHRPA